MGDETLIRVSATDPETGETESTNVPPGGYVIVCAEGRQVASEQRYANGTIVVTTKRTEASDAG